MNETLAGWMATTTWDQSRRYLEAHAGALLTDAAEAALADLVDANPHEQVLVVHLELLRAARVSGVDAPYETLATAARQHALAERLVTWVGTQTWEDARTFLDSHAGELLTDEAEAGLARLAADHPEQPDVLVHRGLLSLCRLDGVDKAYDLLDDIDRIRRLATSPHLRDEPLRAVAVGRLLAGLLPDDGSAQVALAVSALRVDERAEAEAATLRCRRLGSVDEGRLAADQLRNQADLEPDLARACSTCGRCLGDTLRREVRRRLLAARGVSARRCRGRRRGGSPFLPPRRRCARRAGDGRGVG